MRGYSPNTKYNQITPKPPKLESNNSQDRNSNRNLLKESFYWLLKICRMILIVFGIYLMVSFFCYSKNSVIDTEHFCNADGKSTEVQIIKTSDKFNIISCSVIGNDELSLKAYRWKLFEYLCCIIVCSVVCSIIIVIIDE